MSSHISLEHLDVDGAIRNAAEDAGATTNVSGRRDVLRRGAVAGGGVLAATTLFGSILSPAEAAISKTRKSPANDVKILQYALTLEYLESTFYLQAIQNIKFTNEKLRFFARVTGQHEKDHVGTLRTVLGKKSFASPNFDFGNAVKDEKTFAATAQVLEDTGVAAYAGQGGNISQKGVVIAALSIHSVEARHAAWIRYLNGGSAPGSGDKSPAPVAFDAALTEKQVLTAVGATGFIKG